MINLLFEETSNTCSRYSSALSKGWTLPCSIWMVYYSQDRHREICIMKGLCRSIFVDKDPFSQSYGFSSSHVWMWELDHKESWGPKNWSFQSVVLEKTLGSPLDSKEIKPVHPKGNQSWIFTGRFDAEAEAPIIVHLMWTADSLAKTDAGWSWGQEEKGMTEDEMVGWHHWLDSHESEQILGDSEGQGSLVCCSPWGHKESDMT